MDATKPNSRDLCLFTTFYPFGKYEVYLHNEIEAHAKTFRKVYIFPLRPEGELRELPANVEVVRPDELPTVKGSGAKWVMKDSGLAMRVFRADIKHYGSGKVFRKLKYHISLLGAQLKRAQQLMLWLKENELNRPVYYSNWFIGWATVPAVMKARAQVPGFICRAHGYDLYTERRLGAYIPFRPFQLEQVTQVFAISKFGEGYLKELFPKYSAKVKQSYLGVPDRGVNPFVPDQLTIVSASNMNAVKRVHLIVESLKHVTSNVKWVHFGSGELSEAVQEQARQLPVNVTVEFKGRVSSEELMDYYRTVPISLFVNMSGSEGVPVSVMEAISFGIPVLATDVGGTSEVVTERTGQLLAKEFSPKEVANWVMAFPTSPMNTEEFRSGARAFWNANFNAASNYNSFIAALQELPWD